MLAMEKEQGSVFYCQNLGSRPVMFSFCCGITGPFNGILLGKVILGSMSFS